MFATEQDISLLEKIQEADRARELAEKEFNQLPQRQSILELREKLKDIYKKKTQVQDMLDDAETSFDKLVSEDAKLTEKQQDIEKTLTEVKGDYRSVESLTKDLHGVQKRKAALGKESESVGAQIDKISAVMKQVMQAINNLEAQEKQEVEQFRKQGTALRTTIEESKKAREELSAQLSGVLLKQYEEALKRCGGVALSHLVNNGCSACRTSFDFNKLKQIKEQAPLATCPNCSRLLIVNE